MIVKIYAKRKEKWLFSLAVVSTIWLLNSKICHFHQMEYINLPLHYVLCVLWKRETVFCTFNVCTVFREFFFVQRQHYEKLIWTCKALIKLLCISTIKHNGLKILKVKMVHKRKIWTKHVFTQILRESYYN